MSKRDYYLRARRKAAETFTQPPFYLSMTLQLTPENAHRNRKPEALPIHQPKPIPDIDRQAARYNSNRAAFELALQECAGLIAADERDEFWRAFDRMLELTGPVLHTDRCEFTREREKAKAEGLRRALAQMVRPDDFTSKGTLRKDVPRCGRPAGAKNRRKRSDAGKKRGPVSRA